MEQVNKKPLVVGIGEFLWDMLPTSRKVGGAPINFVYHASRLGAEGYAISAVGDDDFGNDLLAELNRNNIRYLVEKVPYPTGTVQVFLDEAGIPEYTIQERVAWDHLSPTSDAIDLVEQADAICFGSLAQRSLQSRETIQSIISFAPEESYRCFDMNLRQHYFSKEIIQESLYLANVLKVNQEELKVMRNLFRLDGTDREVADWFRTKYNLRMVILTAGDSYSTVFSEEEISTMPTPVVKVVDTVGAGDAFTGALLMALLDGAGLKESHRFAVEKAAFVCSKEGAWPLYE